MQMFGYAGEATVSNKYTYGYGRAGIRDTYVDKNGGGKSHSHNLGSTLDTTINILNPYTVVYIWRRIS